MIKKILSVALSLAMLLTLVSSLPVAAAGETLPYIFEDFEADGNAAGPYGIGKALKTEGTYSKDITGLDALFAGNVKVSFNIKADEATSAKIALVSEYDLGELPANEWVTIEETIAVEGNIADTFAIVADSAFAIDDLKIENADISEKPDDAEEVAGVKRFYYDFEDAEAPINVTALIISGDTTEESSVSRTNRKGADNSYGLRHNLTSGGAGKTVQLAIAANPNAKLYNVVTKVEFWAKGDAIGTNGATVAFTTGGENVSYAGVDAEVVDGKVVFDTTLSRTGSGNYYTAYFKNNSTSASPAAAVENFYIEVTGTNQLTFGIDEIAVTDYYLPANADFDIFAGEDVWGWTATNATIAAADGVAEVKATAANPAISQKVAFENDHKYTISFKAAGSEGDTLVVSVENTVKEIALTEAMSEYYIIYRAEVDGDYAYPELKFALKGAAAEDVFSVSAIKVIKASNYKLANVKDVVVAGSLVEKNALTVSYNDVVDEDITILATVVNLYQEKDGYNVCVDTATESSDENEVTLELPANCAGEEFFVEVISVAAAGHGLTARTEIGAAAAAVAYSDYSAALVDSTATVSLSLENNRAEGADDIKAIVLVVLLDENGVLVGFGTEEVVIAAGESDDFSLEVAATNGVAASYKVFVLDCADAATPSLANTTMRELVTLD